MVLRIFPITLIATDIAILKMLERYKSFAYFWQNSAALSAKIKKGAGDFLTSIFLKNLFGILITEEHVNCKKMKVENLRLDSYSQLLFTM